MARSVIQRPSRTIVVAGIIIDKGFLEDGWDYLQFKMYDQSIYQVLLEAKGLRDTWVVCPQKYLWWEQVLRVLRISFKPRLPQMAVCYSSQTLRFHWARAENVRWTSCAIERARNRP